MSLRNIITILWIYNVIMLILGLITGNSIVIFNALLGVLFSWIGLVATGR